MIIVAATPLVGLAAIILVLIALAALAAYGWRQGLFLATVAGLQVLGPFLAALAFARPLAADLEPLGCPPSAAVVAAYLLILAAGVVGIRLAVGRFVPEGVMRLEPWIDQVGGGVIGLLSGVIVGGAIMVGWSLAELPAWARLEPDRLKLDVGSRLLRCFASAAGRDDETRAGLLAGEVVGGAAAAGPRCSEPFVDENADGKRGSAAPSGSAVVGEEERYLDLDGNGQFTAAIPFVDRDGDGRRAIGLLECYRLADWRHVRVMHSPRITSGTAAECPEHQPLEKPVYETVAADVDTGDTVRFAIKDVEGQDGGDVVIDPATGVVTLASQADFETKRRHVFTVLATDASGLTDEKQVTLTVRDVPLE